jgi:hypothetical protein
LPGNNEEIYKGQMALMRVPFLKADSRMKVPPDSSVLSLILLSPKPFSQGSGENDKLGSNPVPLSSMMSSILDSTFLKDR